MTGRGLVGRRMARFILFAAIALDGLAALLLLTPPNMMGVGPMPVPRGIPLGVIILALGGALNVIGLVWMMRIYRADPEGNHSWWRFHRG